MKTQKFVVTVYLRDDEDPGVQEVRHHLYHTIDKALPTLGAFDLGVDRVKTPAVGLRWLSRKFAALTVALGEPYPDEDD